MRNRPYGFEIYNVKTIRTIAQIFVAFSEKLNFNSAPFLSLKLFEEVSEADCINIKNQRYDIVRRPQNLKKSPTFFEVY